MDIKIKNISLVISIALCVGNLAILLADGEYLLSAIWTSITAGFAFITIKFWNR